MANGPERRIYRLCGASAVVVLLALTVPRFFPNPEGGFASAATAILVFLTLLTLAALLAIYLLIVTVRVYRQISTPARIAGISPGVVLVLVLVLMFGFLRF